MNMMAFREFSHVVAAIFILAIVASFSSILAGNLISLLQALLFSAAIILVVVVFQKVAAHALDADVEHTLFGIYYYGFKDHHHFKKEVPAGLVLPLVVSLFTLGIGKLTSILVFETRALKTRAAKRFGYYSYSEMTDWHNGLIGASGIVGVLLLSIVGYVVGFESLTKLAAYYAFWNMIPLYNLDGAQIFFGSRIVWTTLASITLLFTLYALVL
jgi:hypothetical protein